MPSDVESSDGGGTADRQRRTGPFLVLGLAAFAALFLLARLLLY